jgi:hypothetical protein
MERTVKPAPNAALVPGGEQRRMALLLLRAQLWLRRAGPLVCAVLLLAVLALAAWSWVWTLRGQQATRDSAAAAVATAETEAPQVLASAAPPATPEQNLALFYSTLGEQRYAEQQVKILFGLAAKAGLTLNQGEYKRAVEQASGVETYQVVLPVKGSYQAVWAFTLGALREIPFAALDEISFRRDSIADNTLEARVRLTFYLKRGTGTGIGTVAAAAAVAP